ERSRGHARALGTSEPPPCRGRERRERCARGGHRCGEGPGAEPPRRAEGVLPPPLRGARTATRDAPAIRRGASAPARRRDAMDRGGHREAARAGRHPTGGSRPALFRRILSRGVSVAWGTRTQPTPNTTARAEKEQSERDP